MKAFISGSFFNQLFFFFSVPLFSLFFFFWSQNDGKQRLDFDFFHFPTFSQEANPKIG